MTSLTLQFLLQQRRSSWIDSVGLQNLLVELTLKHLILTPTTSAFTDRLRQMYEKAALEKAGKLTKTSAGNGIIKLGGYHLEMPQDKHDEKGDVSLLEARLPRPVAVPSGELTDVMEHVIGQQVDQPWLVSSEARAPSIGTDRIKASPAQMTRQVEISEYLRKELSQKRKSAMEWAEKTKLDAGEDIKIKRAIEFTPQLFHSMMTIRER